ncbi:MAG TPA: aldo/keto reductase [Rhizomicrobium sp.]|jgi:aryl-alcohol dehydrogenase-like predicted oxidoreductase
MKYNRLGNTGMFVSEICLGTMTFGGEGFWKVVGELDQKNATGIVSRALEAGVNFIDTADVYSMGVSETMTGQALKDIGVPRSDVFVATKCYGRTGKGPNDIGASRGHIMDSVQRSLDRLKLDHIDLYQIHAQDSVTPVEETVRALDDLTRQGLVRYVGCSNWAAWKLMKALGYAQHNNLARFETIQSYYSIAGRDLERDIVPALEDQKVGLMVWSPLAGGLLSGKFGPGSNGPEGARRVAFDFPPVDKDRAWKCVDAMRDVAKAHDVSAARVALAYILAKSFVTTVIIGTKTLEQLDDNLAAAGLELTGAEMSKLDEVSALPAEYPGWMLARQGAERVPQPK